MNRQLSVTVSEKSEQYLEWLCDEAQRAGGNRLAKATIVRALLNVVMRVDIDVSAVSSQADLEQRIWEALNRRTPQE